MWRFAKQASAPDCSSRLETFICERSSHGQKGSGDRRWRMRVPRAETGACPQSSQGQNLTTVHKAAGSRWRDHETPA